MSGSGGEGLSTGLQPTHIQNPGCARGVAPRCRRVPVPTQHCAGSSLLGFPPASLPQEADWSLVLASGFQLGSASGRSQRQIKHGRREGPVASCWAVWAVGDPLPKAQLLSTPLPQPLSCQVPSQLAPGQDVTRGFTTDPPRAGRLPLP